jgi:hypothetical protein
MVVLMDEGVDLIVQTISRDDEVCRLHPVFQVLLAHEPRCLARGYMHGVNQRTTLPKARPDSAWKDQEEMILESFRRGYLLITHGPRHWLGREDAHAALPPPSQIRRLDDQAGCDRCRSSSWRAGISDSRTGGGLSVLGPCVVSGPGWLGGPDCRGEGRHLVLGFRAPCWWDCRTLTSIRPVIAGRRPSAIPAKTGRSRC